MVTFSCHLPVPPHPPRCPSIDHSRQRMCSVGRYVLGGLLVFLFPILSHLGRLAFRNVVSIHCTHNSTQSITAHNHRKYRMSLQSVCSRVSPHTHMSQCACTHIAPRHITTYPLFHTHNSLLALCIHLDPRD